MTQMAKEDKGKYGIVEFTYKFNIDGTTVDVTTMGMPISMTKHKLLI